MMIYTRLKKKQKILEIKFEQARAAYTQADKDWEKIKSKDARKLKKDRSEKTKQLESTKNYLEQFKNERRDLISKYGIDVIGYGFFEESQDCIQVSPTKGIKWPAPWYDDVIQSSLENKKCMVCLQEFEEESETHNHIKSLLGQGTNDDFEKKMSKARGGFSSRNKTIKDFNDDLEKIDTHISAKEFEIKDQVDAINKLSDEISALGKWMIRLIKQKKAWKEHLAKEKKLLAHTTKN